MADASADAAVGASVETEKSAPTAFTQLTTVSHFSLSFGKSSVNHCGA